MQIIMEIEEHKLVDVFKCQKRWINFQDKKWLVDEVRFIEATAKPLIKVGIVLQQIDIDFVNKEDINQICSSFIFKGAL